ncbi:SO2930 family diheme c-type cytochrome [Fulvivirgaceae bacterium BMA12]|uniref:SO2930 family diheme c-type cytochrome n=1 Tax=Agaribacillus aureus TaxID=3051825 RepID=A0ABT8L3P8_9BACT|nr:SO2930 family diheme c-type cytochrome [Fulvivirgaceae bacterium BMA12]
MRVVCFFIVVVTLWGCTAKPGKEQPFTFHDRLSQYGFFEGNMAALKPVSNVIPYELNTPLFTDYAYKARFIKVPEGKFLTSKNGELFYPEGTILIKNFFYYQDEGQVGKGRYIIETRLLMKYTNQWKVATYIWDDDQKEAHREILGATKHVKWVNRHGKSLETDYVIPDNNDCKSCHKKNGKISPIGPKIANLNKMISTGKEDINQLNYLFSRGIIKGLEPTDQLPQMAVWNDSVTYTLDQRARAYLDVNCAHCHNAVGPANNTGLFLEYEQQDLFKLGICKGPVSAAQGSGNLKYDIVPGNAEASILHYRMNSNSPGIAMPELGRTLIHKEGVALIEAWIAGLEGKGCD